MTESAVRVRRPDRHLHLVRPPALPAGVGSPGPGGRAARPGDAGGEAWVRHVGELTGRSLGPDFVPTGLRLAVLAQRYLPGVLARGHPQTWAAALVFLLAEHTSLFAFDRCVTRTSFARELGVTLPTLRRRVAELRPALAADLPCVSDPSP